MQITYFRNRTLTNIVWACFLGAFLTALPAFGTEYFVSKQGNDGNTGQGTAQAFLTIQKGVDALEPGDTLTIGPGEYYENVLREGLGSMEVDTIIRAEIPGTTVLRGDIPAPEFKKVDGFRFVYAAKLDQKPKAVIEHHGLYTMTESASPSELEFDPGAFHYDAESKMLYISNPDLTSPDENYYTMAVTDRSGLILKGPRRVIIDGLAATGFHPDWGILLGNPVSCTVRNCVCFLNVGGIVLEPNEGLSNGSGGDNNVVENCLTYGNSFGGIVRYGANNDIIRNCHTYRNGHTGEHFGVMHYGSMHGSLLIKNVISWGHNFNFSIKPNSTEPGRVENCVGLGYIRLDTNKMSHNLLEGRNESDRDGRNVPPESIAYRHEKDLDWDFEYADHLNLDFRLQSDSHFRNAAPDGSDRGPYQYEANIFYVAPSGDDQADGLSMRKPWKTLKHALSKLKPGDTLYLAEGTYTAASLNKAGDGKAPISILGRGRGTVIITGTQSINQSNGIVFKRLNFATGADLNKSLNVAFKNCTFFGKNDGLSANKTTGLKVTHSVFADVPLNLKKTTTVILSGNLYANTGKAAVHLDSDSAIRYSDYNSYQNTENCWDVKGKTCSFATVQKQQYDQHSQTLSPKFATESTVPCLQNASAFKSIGPRSTAIGIHHEYQDETATKPLDIFGPFVQSVSDTTANIEWWQSGSANLELAWGYSKETEKVASYRTGKRFTSYTLTDLEPGKTYQFKILTGRQTSQGDKTVISFTTADKPAEPRILYVAPDGDDSNDGLSRKHAFRTICRAANIVGPGDTVLIAGGEYHETVRIRATGTEGRPITFRCIKGEKAILRGVGLSMQFELIGKSDHRFDGLYFREVEHWNKGFIIKNSPRVQITRCFDTMIGASDSPNLVVRNCLLQGGWTNVAVSNCDGAVIENNVLIMTILRQLGAYGNALVRRNIICENQRNKTHLDLVHLNAGAQEEDNCFYTRWPVEERLEINNMPLPQYQAQTGSTSFAANPMMLGIRGFRAAWQETSADDFDELFATNPELILRGVGIQHEAFSDYEFKTHPWPYDRTWAEKFLKASKAATALVQAGKHDEALAAYATIVEQFPMSDRLKSDVLEKACFCAEQMEDYDRALQLAEAIPVELLSTRAQMRALLAKEQYAELLKRFDYGEGELRYYIYRQAPEMDDVIVDIYSLRSQAYVHMGDLAAAEADLKVVNDNRFSERYTSGEAIHDVAWLRLGDFYRTTLKDDNRALEAYLKVCSRTTWSRWDSSLAKPVSTGATETLVAATKLACDILRKQGKLEEVTKLEASLAKAQADAAAALRKK